VTTSEIDAGEARKRRLVADRMDFLIVYFASLFTAIALLAHAMASNDSLTLSVVLFPAIAAVFISAVPPLVAMLIPSGRRVLQVLFGIALLPVVGACAIYVNTIIPQVFG
jgi:hypothetical protein